MFKKKVEMELCPDCGELHPIIKRRMVKFATIEKGREVAGFEVELRFIFQHPLQFLKIYNGDYKRLVRVKSEEERREMLLQIASEKVGLGMQVETEFDGKRRRY